MRHLLVVAVTLLASTTGCATFSWEGAAGANVQATAYARSTWTETAAPSPVTSQLPGAPLTVAPPAVATLAVAPSAVVLAPRLLPAARPAFLARRSMAIAMAPTLR